MHTSTGNNHSHSKSSSCFSSRLVNVTFYTVYFIFSVCLPSNEPNKPTNSIHRTFASLTFYQLMVEMQRFLLHFQLSSWRGNLHAFASQIPCLPVDVVFAQFIFHFAQKLALKLIHFHLSYINFHTLQYIISAFSHFENSRSFR